MRKIVIGLIWIYRLALSPWLGGNCRFHPTCSVYAAEAVDKYGSIRGLWFAVRRIGRCHPWNAGGYDPVPETTDLEKAHSQ